MIIGICDDDKVWGRRASHIIGEYRKKTSLDVEIQYFPDKESLLNYEGDRLKRYFWISNLETGMESNWQRKYIRNGHPA